MSVSTVSGSGNSSLYELMALKKQADASDLSGKVVDSRDSDGDGKLTAKELNISSESFGKADTDGDGVLSEDELAAGVESDMQVMKEVMDQFMAGGKAPDFNEMQNLMSDTAERPSAADTSSRIIGDYDSDGDGSLSASELTIDEDTFNQLDSDGDGQLSQEELASSLADDGETARQLMSQLMSSKGLPDFEELKNLMASASRPDADEISSSIISESDTDADGALSSSELDISSELFGSLDTDGDGEISQEELAAAFSSSFDQLDEQLAESGQPPPPPPSAEESSKSVVDDRDTNGDGVLSAEELAVSDELFGQVDADGDGFVSQEELADAFSANMPGAMAEEETAVV